MSGWREDAIPIHPLVGRWRRSDACTQGVRRLRRSGVHVRTPYTRAPPPSLCLTFSMLASSGLYLSLLRPLSPSSERDPLLLRRCFVKRSGQDTVRERLVSFVHVLPCPGQEELAS